MTVLPTRSSLLLWFHERVEVRVDGARVDRGDVVETQQPRWGQAASGAEERQVGLPGNRPDQTVTDDPTQGVGVMAPVEPINTTSRRSLAAK